MVITYAIIFLLAATPFFEIAAIIPIAIIGGVPAIPTMVVALLGNLATIVLLIVFIDKVKTWQENRKQKKRQKKRRELEVEVESDEEQVTEVAEKDDEKKHQRARNIWGKYGLPGLAFMGPFLIGSHLSAFLAVSFGGTRNRTLVLMTASLVLWTFILGGGAYFGFDYFVADGEDLGFITRLLRLEE